jgi:hypothetical protein
MSEAIKSELISSNQLEAGGTLNLQGSYDLSDESMKNFKILKKLSQHGILTRSTMPLFQQAYEVLQVDKIRRENDEKIISGDLEGVFENIKQYQSDQVAPTGGPQSSYLNFDDAEDLHMAQLSAGETELDFASWVEVNAPHLDARYGALQNIESLSSEGGPFLAAGYGGQTDFDYNKYLGIDAGSDSQAVGDLSMNNALASLDDLQNPFNLNTIDELNSNPYMVDKIQNPYIPPVDNTYVAPSYTGFLEPEPTEYNVFSKKKI